MPRLSDEFLRSAEFRVRLHEADEYAGRAGLDVWPVRIVWVGLVFGTLGARRFSQRRGNYRSSRAWSCYCNLVESGIFSESPEGLIYVEEPRYETNEGVMEWFDLVCRIANGENKGGCF